jgi:hypothetical protein
MTTDTKQQPLTNRAPLSGRTVEITDEDESIVIAFLPVGQNPAFTTATLNQPEKGKLP